MRFRVGLKQILAASLSLAFIIGLIGNAVVAQDGAQPKHDLKEVMKVAHKDGLLKKIIAGQASQEEKQTLLDLYISMVEAKPKKGEMTSWHHLAGGAALAAAKVVVGREGAVAELEKASNCKACHDVHK
ncbi:MAG: hypothetical protein KDB03_01955 [Planctomycetales bacterium]|nr:hypothetical protein [Planctomycetales bacterium]